MDFILRSVVLPLKHVMKELISRIEFSGAGVMDKSLKAGLITKTTTTKSQE